MVLSEERRAEHHGRHLLDCANVELTVAVARWCISDFAKVVLRLNRELVRFVPRVTHEDLDAGKLRDPGRLAQHLRFSAPEAVVLIEEKGVQAPEIGLGDNEVGSTRIKYGNNFVEFLDAAVVLYTI